MTPITAEEFFARLSAGKCFRGCDCSAINGAGLDLAGADFQDGAPPRLLQGANLRLANLKGSDCTGIIADDRTSFAKADCDEANFEIAKLGGADFSGASLDDASLLGARGVAVEKFGGASLARTYGAAVLGLEVSERPRNSEPKLRKRPPVAAQASAPRDEYIKQF